MLRGMSTINLGGRGPVGGGPLVHRAAGRGAAGRGPGYAEFRIGDYQHELGIIDQRFAPPELAAGPAERSSTGTSTRRPEPWTNWSRWVPSNSRRSPSAAPGFRHRLGRQARRQHVGCVFDGSRRSSRYAFAVFLV